MVCRALGRCRICAKKHELPIFGSEENQHALIEKIHLQLIVLNTVCIDCIAKFEQFVKKSASTATFESRAAQRERANPYQRLNDDKKAEECAASETRPVMRFYVEADNIFPSNISSASENERLKPQDESVEDREETTSCTGKRLINDDIEMRSLTIESKEPKAVTKIRARRKVQSQLCCDFCPKEFTHRGDLKRHKRKHTGEKPYECPECRKTFSQLSNLTRHRLVHSGERPFACAECGQSYSRKGRLANHIGRELCRRKRRLSMHSASQAKKPTPG